MKRVNHLSVKCDSRFSLFKLPIYRAPNKVLLPTEKKRLLVDDKIFKQIEKNEMRFGYVTDFAKDPALVIVADHIFDTFSKIGTIAVVDEVKRTHNHMNALIVRGTERFTVLNVESMENNVPITLSSFFVDQNNIVESEKERELYKLLLDIKEAYSDVEMYLPIEVEDFKPDNTTTTLSMDEKQRQEMFSFAVANMISGLGVPERIALLHSQDSNLRFDWLLKSIATELLE